MWLHYSLYRQQSIHKIVPNRINWFVLMMGLALETSAFSSLYYTIRIAVRRPARIIFAPPQFRFGSYALSSSGIWSQESTDWKKTYRSLSWALLPPRRHVVWRDTVDVGSSGSGLKSECADIFSSELDLWLLRHTDEVQRGRNSCLWLQSRSVLSSFGVVLMSCRVNFHVVRSALQYSACKI